MITDNITMKGDLHIVIRDTVTNKIKVDRYEKNLVVGSGKNLIASRLHSNSDAVIGWMSAGTSSLAPTNSDTTLGAEIGRVAITLSGGTLVDNTLSYEGVFGAGVATGSLVEAGLFNNSVGGTMLSRTTFAVINKGASDEMTITWVITIG